MAGAGSTRPRLGHARGRVAGTGTIRRPCRGRAPDPSPPRSIQDSWCRPPAQVSLSSSLLQHTGFLGLRAPPPKSVRGHSLHRSHSGNLVASSSGQHVALLLVTQPSSDGPGLPAVRHCFQAGTAEALQMGSPSALYAYCLPLRLQLRPAATPADLCSPCLHLWLLLGCQLHLLSCKLSACIFKCMVRLPLESAASSNGSLARPLPADVARPGLPPQQPMYPYMPYMQPSMAQQVKSKKGPADWGPACFPAPCLLICYSTCTCCSLPTVPCAAQQRWLLCTQPNLKPHRQIPCTLAGRCLYGKAALSPCRCRCMGPTT